MPASTRLTGDSARRIGRACGLGLALVLLALASDPAAGPASAAAPTAARDGKRCLPVERVARAARYARDREGRVSFAFADECRRLLGHHRFRRHTSHSVVKVMLLVAYLRRNDVAGRDLTRRERQVLGAMIRSSDNGAADEIFAAVGPGGLEDLARRSEMRGFRSAPYWGATQISAGDMASFFHRIERFVPRRFEHWVLGLTGRIVGSQRWGVADSAPPGWRLSFKGGWYPAVDGWRVNQAATLRRNGRRISIAVLTDGAPSFGYGRETIRRIARILFEGYRR